jgi:hypothetical protein
MRLRRLTDSQLLGRNDALGFELMNAREPRQKSFPNSEIRHSWGRGTAEARFVRVVRSSPQRGLSRGIGAAASGFFAKNASKRITSVDNAMTQA